MTDFVGSDIYGTRDEHIRRSAAQGLKKIQVTKHLLTIMSRRVGGLKYFTKCIDFGVIGICRVGGLEIKQHFININLLNIGLKMRLFEIETTAHIETKSPAECSRAEINAFCEIVASGGEVSTSGLLSRVKQAKILAFLTIGNKLVGVTAIKIPANSYRDAVFAKAGAANPEHFKYELGWLIIDPACRGQGYSEKLIRAALNKVGGNVFATSSAENTAVHRINDKVGLLPTGHPYQGSSGRELILFTKI